LSNFLKVSLTRQAGTFISKGFVLKFFHYNVYPEAQCCNIAFSSHSQSTTVLSPAIPAVQSLASSQFKTKAWWTMSERETLPDCGHSYDNTSSSVF
jgi:hypothetical protein